MRTNAMKPDSKIGREMYFFYLRRRKSMKAIGRYSVVMMILISLLALSAFAGNNTRTGTAGATELLIPVGAQGIALGQENLIFASGSEALYWNPAGLSRMDRDVEALFSQMSYIADISIGYGALGVKTDFGTLGFSLKSIAFGDIPVTTESFPDGNGQTYSPTFVTLGGTYSKLLTDRISVGVTANLISERIMSTSASGVGFNVGIQYFGLGVPGLDLGIAVKNIGPDMTYDGSDLLRIATAQQGLRGAENYKVSAASFQLPSDIEIGIGYQRQIDENFSFRVGGNFQNNNSSDDVYGLGGELSYMNIVALRGSYLTAPQAADDPTGQASFLYDFALGVGLHHDVGGVDISFDYAYRHLKLMSSNNAISIKLGF